MSDLGSHMNDLPFWALDLDAPTTIEAQGPKVHPDLAPASMQVTAAGTLTESTLLGGRVPDLAFDAAYGEDRVRVKAKGSFRR